LESFRAAETGSIIKRREHGIAADYLLLKNNVPQTRSDYAPV